MKFKALCAQQEIINFLLIFQTLEKVKSSCYLFLSPSTMKLSVTQHNVIHNQYHNESISPNDHIQAFAEVGIREMFVEYIIESQANNCILLEVLLKDLVKAFQSCVKSNICSMKLSKRSRATNNNEGNVSSQFHNSTPCLCIESYSDVDILHDIPVKVLKVSELNYHLPPQVPKPRVQLEVHSLNLRTILKPVVEKLKNIQKDLYLRASSKTGLLQLNVKCPGIDIVADLTSLKPYIPEMEDRNYESDEEEEVRTDPNYFDCEGNKLCTAKVDIRKFSTLLQCSNLPFDSSILCFVKDLCLVMYIPIPGGSITYYCPTLPLQG